MTPEAIARICHAANREYCKMIGDDSIAEWGQAPAWQRESTIVGVETTLDKPDTTPEMSHFRWMVRKLKEGWVHGPVKDADMKTHPALLPYMQLPRNQKAKDHLFLAIVRIMRGV